MLARLAIAQSAISDMPSDLPASFLALTIMLGRFYQIRDDYSNLVSEEVPAVEIFPSILAFNY